MKKFIGDFRRGLFLVQYLAMLTSGLNLVCSGMHYGWSSPSLPKLLHDDSYIPTTKEEGSWIAVILLPGGVCGSILGGLLLDRIGRKNVILLTSIPFFTSWMMVAYARSVSVLIAARFIAGISDGLIICASPLYLGEISSPKIRGFIGSAASVAYILGMLLINIIGSYLSMKTTALVSASIPVLLILTFAWIPESPYYLIMKGRTDKARRSLKILNGTEEVEEELNRLTKAVKEQNSNSGKYLDLFTVKSNRKALFIMMGTRGTQQLSGTTAITFYAQIIFKEAGDVVSPEVASIIYFSLQLILSGLSSIIVDKTGRKPLMVISITGSAIALLLGGIYFYIKNSTEMFTTGLSIIPTAALIIFVIMYGFGLQTIPVLLLGEIFPTNVKAFAICVSDMYFATITTTISKFFQITKDEFGLHVPFFAFTVCCLLGLLFVIFYVPETKGKTLEEIQLELKGGPERLELLSTSRETFRKFEVY